MTLAAFHLDGIIPVCNDRFIMKAKEGAKTEAASFNIPCGKASTPIALLHLGFLSWL